MLPDECRYYLELGYFCPGLTFSLQQNLYYNRLLQTPVFFLIARTNIH